MEATYMIMKIVGAECPTPSELIGLQKKLDKLRRSRLSITSIAYEDASKDVPSTESLAQARKELRC